jgi:hypothetical protein
VDGYEILGPLGSGGMGIVYHARQVPLDRPVALKMILAGAHAGRHQLARFRFEAEAIARLQHPHIVQVFEAGERDGWPYLAMEYVDGGSLAQKLNGTPLPPHQGAQLVESLARAVSYAHQRGIIHCDLKPANVLLTEDGTPKITDFGLARRLDGEAGLTQSGSIRGTPSYMAPEQAEGRAKDIGPATDVYALGAVLYELLTGRPPFRAATVLETLDQVRSRPPLSPRCLQPRLPRHLEVICLTCLQKDPRQRYPSAGALAEDLRRFRGGEPIQARRGAFERLAQLLGHRVHDIQFHGWGDLLLLLVPFILLAHLAVFLVGLHHPEHLTLMMVAPLALLALAVATLLFRQRARARAPASAAERQLASLFLGLLTGAIAVALVCAWLAPPERPGDQLAAYPFWSALAGLFFFSMGSHYWGRCYLFGLAGFTLPLLMAWNLAFAPLEFAVSAALIVTTLGLHLRRLGREAGPDESP